MASGNAATADSVFAIDNSAKADYFVCRKMSANRSQRTPKRVQVRKSGADGVHTNGYIHVASPATASEIRKRLHIKAAQVSNILRIFKAVGVEV